MISIDIPPKEMSTKDHARHMEGHTECGNAVRLESHDLWHLVDQKAYSSSLQDTVAATGSICICTCQWRIKKSKAETKKGNRNQVLGRFASLEGICNCRDVEVES